MKAYELIRILEKAPNNDVEMLTPCGFYPNGNTLFDTFEILSFREEDKTFILEGNWEE